MARTYPLLKSGKTATRFDYRSGMTEIHVLPATEAHAVVRRTGPGMAWRLYQGDAERMVTLTLAKALRALDIAECHPARSAASWARIVEGASNG